MTQNGYEPAPGELRLPMIATGVLCALSTLGLIAALICSFFFENLGTTITAALVMVILSGIAFVMFLIQRRNYLRDRANGKIIERKPYTGGDIHSG